MVAFFTDFTPQMLIIRERIRKQSVSTNKYSFRVLMFSWRTLLVYICIEFCYDINVIINYINSELARLCTTNENIVKDIVLSTGRCATDRKKVTLAVV